MRHAKAVNERQRYPADRRTQAGIESVRRGETLLREVHHRVKNNLQIVSSLLTMQGADTGDIAVKEALSDAVVRVSAIALIHAQLCEAPNVVSLDMRAFVHELVANLRRTVSTPATDIVTSVDVAPLHLDLDSATPCGLIISELLTNAFQHAFAHQERGVITVRLVSDRRRVTLEVEDSGGGLPANAERRGSKGLGLRLVRLLATKQLRGRLTIARRHGTKFSVTFPLAPRGAGLSYVPRRQERTRS